MQIQQVPIILNLRKALAAFLNFVPFADVLFSTTRDIFDEVLETPKTSDPPEKLRLFVIPRRQEHEREVRVSRPAYKLKQIYDTDFAITMIDNFCFYNCIKLKA